MPLLPLCCRLFYKNIEIIRLFLPFYLKRRRSHFSLPVQRFEHSKFMRSFLLQTNVFRFPALDLLMQFSDIICNRQQNALSLFAFPWYRNLWKPVSSFRSPKLPSDWILRFTRRRIMLSVIIQHKYKNC